MKFIIALLALTQMALANFSWDQVSSSVCLEMIRGGQSYYCSGVAID